MDHMIAIPKLSSLILKHSLNAPLDGLETIPREDQPPVAVVFWFFRVMVALGFAMLALGLLSLWARWKGVLYNSYWLHTIAIVMGPAGFLAVLAGWITTEVGRQPFTIYGLMRTSESHSGLEVRAVAVSLIAFIIVYFFVFGAGTFFLLRMIGKTPGTPRFGLRDGWVHPTLIAEIEFRAWTADGKLRHAAYKGLRERQDNADVFRHG